ncbi:hypothetical protein ACU4GD_17185 [Cupriavidus basilensis]
MPGQEGTQTAFAVPGSSAVLSQVDTPRLTSESPQHDAVLENTKTSRNTSSGLWFPGLSEGCSKRLIDGGGDGRSREAPGRRACTHDIRIGEMDRAGIDFNCCRRPVPACRAQFLTSEDAAIGRARREQRLAAQVARHPTRFVLFLPRRRWHDPVTAARLTGAP